MSDDRYVNRSVARVGRIIIGTFGLHLVAVGGWHGYANPDTRIVVTATLLGFGLVLVCISFAAPDRFCAHFGLNLPWLLP